MTQRELYDELGRQLGMTAEAEFVDMVRSLAGEALGRIVTDLLQAKTPEQMDNVGRATEDVGDSIREIVAKRVEGAIFAKSTAETAATVAPPSGEACPVCGTVGQHLCRMSRQPEPSAPQIAPDPPVPEYKADDGEVIDVSGIKRIKDFIEIIDAPRPE
jgi:hypothetical protein